jgi:hypothetical protein
MESHVEKHLIGTSRNARITPHVAPLNATRTTQARLPSLQRFNA